MSNREEFGKILTIVGTEEYPEDKDFLGGPLKQFMIWRNLMYIFAFGMSFLILQGNRIIYINDLLRLALTWVTLLIVLIYIIQKNKMRREHNRYLYRECRPDIGVSRCLSTISRLVNRQVIWSIVHHNLGCGLYRLGQIEKASKCLSMMQESCTTANSMLYAIHLKLLISLYYNDYDMVISSAGEAVILYSKVRHNNWNNKLFNDIQKASVYAQCCINGDYGQIYSILQTPNERPLDEVTRHYYLYLIAIKLQDFETAEKCREYVRLNAGTTWYGRAIQPDFIPEKKPDNYPAFSVSPEAISKPSSFDRSRLNYLLIGALIALAFFIVPMMIKGY